MCKEQVLPRIVFCDLDGTLLATDKSMSDRTRRALRGLAMRDILFVPSTGRSVAGLPSEVIALAHAQYAVTADGASIYRLTPAGHESLRMCQVDRNMALGLLRLVHAIGSYIDVFSDGEAYVERGELDKLDDMPLLSDDRAYIRRVRNEIDQPLEEFVAQGHAVERLTVFYTNLDTRARIIAYARDSGGLACYTSGAANIEVTSSDVSKGSALLWLCRHLGVSPSQTLAFGDSMNDVPMLREAGVGIAMSNAREGVREQADGQTRLDNDHSGVAEYLEELLCIQS
ncbi:MAG: HAD-IIB family hydrolase [Olsenella profusa]